MLVRRIDRATHGEGQSLDRVAFQAEMRLAEAGRQARAEDLELARLARQPELDAVPVEPRRAMPLAGGDRRAAEAADMLGHLGEIVVREHRDMPEHVMEAV